MKSTRGMRRRTAKLARRSEIMTRETLVAGIDIARKECVVVFVRAADKARVGRLRVPTTPAGLLAIADRGRQLAGQEGCDRLVLAMETTGHYWKILARTAGRIGVDYVTVQSFVVARARELDDLTRDKTDQRDAGLIADLAIELRFNEVQLETGPWAELRSLADARDRYRVEMRAALQEQRALLELTWPALLEHVPDLDGSHLQAMLRLGLSPVEIGGLPRARFTARLRREHVGRFLPWMAGRLLAAARCAVPEDQAPSATLRLQLAGQRNRAGTIAVARLDAELAAAFDATGLAWLRGQLRGLGDSQLHNLLALTGDPRRLDDARCMVKLAGSNPTERSSGEQQAAGGIHRRGRPLLRLLAHQAAVCLVLHHPDFAARFTELTTRPHRPLHKKQAYVAVANKLLRTLWALAVSGEPYQRALPRAA
ncbi:MAG TPA: IS110 family transposase [Patescibacteria group bacterium]|nr:IS110 family transposase [Patescibacteria group bacterium]